LLTASRAMFEDSAEPIHEPTKENHRVGTASALIKA
jgi:hypothetical protein